MRHIFLPAVAVHDTEFELLLDVVIEPDLPPLASLRARPLLSRHRVLY